MLLIFDLDGTLIDSARDLAISMNATREYCGMAPLDPAVIYSYVGNGAATLVRRALGAGASEETVQAALDYFLGFYRRHALANTVLYPGMKEVVDELYAAGHRLAVLTNKPVRISADILRALQVHDRFFRVYGGDSFPAKKPDPIGIYELMREAAAAVTDTLMIGDSATDVQTARNAAVKSCGVSWGFQPDSFVAHPPDLMAAKPGDLPSRISALV